MNIFHPSKCRREPVPSSPTSTLTWHHTQESASTAKQSKNVSYSFQVRFYENTHKKRVGAAHTARLRGVLTQKACAACKHVITQPKLHFHWGLIQVPGGKKQQRGGNKTLCCCLCRILHRILQFFFSLTLSLLRQCQHVIVLLQTDSL